MYISSYIVGRELDSRLLDAELQKVSLLFYFNVTCPGVRAVANGKASRKLNRYRISDELRRA